MITKSDTPLVIRALRSHALECIDQALHARAKNHRATAERLANESSASWQLAERLRTTVDQVQLHLIGVWP